MGPDGQLPDAERRWLKRFGRRDSSADVRLLCFHHAGGSAATFRLWPRQVPASIEVVAVQLPGRADRFREPPFERMAPLVDELIEVLKPLLDRPFSCFGHSMGARVAWALAHTLRERAMPLPRMLFVSSSCAPCTDDGTWDWDPHKDNLEGYLREMGGTPEEVLAEPDLLRALVPTLRCDLEVLSTHDFHPATPLDIPIHAYAGVEDATSPAEKMVGWREETTTRFDFDSVPGGHFFGADAERRVIATIVDDLAPAPGR